MPAGLDPLPVAVCSTGDWNEDLPPLFVADGTGNYLPDDLTGCGARVVIKSRTTPPVELEMTTSNGLLVIGSVATELGFAPMIGIRVPAAAIPPPGVYDRQVFVLRPVEIQPLYSGIVVIQQGL